MTMTGIWVYSSPLTLPPKGARKHFIPLKDPVQSCPPSCWCKDRDAGHLVVNVRLLIIYFLQTFEICSVFIAAAVFAVVAALHSALPLAFFGKVAPCPLPNAIIYEAPTLLALGMSKCWTHIWHRHECNMCPTLLIRCPI